MCIMYWVSLDLCWYNIKLQISQMLTIHYALFINGFFGMNGFVDINTIYSLGEKLFQEIKI